MKYFSFLLRPSQSLRSDARSISSAVQNEASAFLYMSQISACWIGKRTNRPEFSDSNGSGKCLPSSSRRLWSEMDKLLTLSFRLSSSFVSELETDPLDALSLEHEDENEELTTVSGVRASNTSGIDFTGVVNVDLRWFTGGVSKVWTGMMIYFL